jgi:two-component system chemotaxis sensor kinase CheA
MLDEDAGNGTADKAVSAAILSELGQLVGSSSAPQSAAAADAQINNAPVCGAAHDWHIHFRPSPNILLNGTNPLMLLRELKELGQLKIELHTDAIPPLSEIQPEHCYLVWDITLTTSAGADAIHDVFIFVEDECEMTIEQLSPPSKEAAAPVAAPSQKVQASQSPTGTATAPAAASSIRVAADKLDELVNLVGELVTVQARLSELAGRHDDPDITEVSEAVDRLTASLRDNSMSIRMLPLKSTFERFRRLVHDLGIELHKDVELVIQGADTELDKTVIDQLTDPLVHLIRNCMDHGIETPEERAAIGKPPAKIHLSAQHSGANVLITVIDDGRGLNVDAVRSRAIERGLIDGSARLSEDEIISLILAPGFSTAKSITDVSGRGVGMDVVKRNVESLRGTLELTNRPGAGVTVTLRLPLTLAIIDGLLVRVGDAHFVLPLANSLECVELTKQDIKNAHGKHIANVRGDIIPYVRLSEYFQMETVRPDSEQIMIVETDDGRYGFVVDQVLGDHQTVIKNLGKLYRNVQVVSGATILGNGTVALILDPHRLVQNAIRSNSQDSTPTAIGSANAAAINARTQDAGQRFYRKGYSSDNS